MRRLRAWLVQWLREHFGWPPYKGTMYIGPSTWHGLRANSPCAIAGQRAGGYVITTKAGRFVVAKQHVRIAR